MLIYSKSKTILIAILVNLLVILNGQIVFSESVVSPSTLKAAPTNSVSKSQANMLIKLEKDLVNSRKISDYNYVQIYLSNHLKDSPSMLDIYVGYANNKFIDGSKFELPPNYKCTSRDWYKKTIKEKTLVFSAVYSDAITGKKIRSISYPIIVNSKIIGVIAADFYIWEYTINIF